VLGAQLPPPFGGRVFVPPDEPAGNGPTVAVTVLRAVPETGFHVARPERVPGGDDARRVVRLSCTVGMTVTPVADEGRSQQVAAVDELLWLVDTPPFRDGRALRVGGDPGFFVEALGIEAADLADPDDVLPDVTLVARGWFWPPGEPPITGPPMRLRLRQVVLPVALEQDAPRLLTGGDPVELTVRVGTAGTFVLDPDEDGGAPVSGAEPFGALAVGLVGTGGRPGAGSLSGGEDGPDGRRLVTIQAGAASVTYTPPDEPALDDLVVRTVLTTGDETRVGAELARFPLAVVAP
jgi:hypothetical protein